MPGLLDFFTRRADTLASHLKRLDDGRETSFVFEGATYTLATLNTLGPLYELALLWAAYEGILAGAQKYTLLGRSFEKPAFEAICKRIDQIVLRMSKTTRGGITVRQVVPL